jgi:hypothetical protein
LPYKDEFIFTDCGIREYWDEELKLLINRDISASINVKRVGLDVFPTIKRRIGNPVVVASTTNSTLKQVREYPARSGEAYTVFDRISVGASRNQVVLSKATSHTTQKINFIMFQEWKTRREQSLILPRGKDGFAQNQKRLRQIGGKRQGSISNPVIRLQRTD